MLNQELINHNLYVPNKFVRGKEELISFSDVLDKVIRNIITDDSSVGQAISPWALGPRTLSPGP